MTFMQANLYKTAWFAIGAIGYVVTQALDSLA